MRPLEPLCITHHHFLTMQIPEVIRAELGPGEQVVWSGRPRQGTVFRGADAFAIPFSLLWVGLAVPGFMGSLRSDASLEAILFSVPFGLVAAYILVGRFIVDSRQRASTFYAVTSQRVIIASGIFGKRVRSLNLNAIPELSLSQRRDGSGTITFGPESPMAGIFRGLPNWPGDRASGPQFELVPQVRDVYEIVRKAQSSIA